MGAQRRPSSVVFDLLMVAVSRATGAALLRKLCNVVAAAREHQPRSCGTSVSAVARFLLGSLRREHCVVVRSTLRSSAPMIHAVLAGHAAHEGPDLDFAQSVQQRLKRSTPGSGYEQIDRE